MRIAYVCADAGVPVFGRKGCSIHVREVIEAMLALGLSVELFAARLDGAPPAHWRNLRVHHLPIPVGADAAEREKLALAANQQTLAALRNAGPFDLVYERYSLWSYAGMEYASDSGTRGILEINAPLIEEQAEHRVLIDRAAAHEVAHRAFSAAGALVAVSPQVAAYLNKSAAARGKVHIISNGVNPSRFPQNLQPALPNPSGLFTVGFVGSMKPWHGLPTLLEAFGRLHRDHPDTRLLIVGEGKAKEHLQDTLANHALNGSVEFTGSVDSIEIPGLLASMDVAVAPYPAMPNFYFSPLKVYEYMAAGRAIVASRIGMIPTMIEHEVSGLLCEAGDADALARDLLRLKSDAGLRQRLGSGARRIALSNYSWEEVVRRTLELRSCHSDNPTSRVEAGS
jgi:glycosyltransferase involved in cell wall biosynthesis